MCHATYTCHMELGWLRQLDDSEHCLTINADSVWQCIVVDAVYVCQAIAGTIIEHMLHIAAEVDGLPHISMFVRVFIQCNGGR